MNKITLILLVAAVFALFGCGSSNNATTNDDNDNPTTLVTVGGKITGRSNTEVSKSSGMLQVAAIDSQGSSWATTTKPNGEFSLQIPPDMKYSLMFLNSAGVYIAVLTDGTQPTAFTPTGNLNIGDITFTGTNANPTEPTALAAIKSAITDVIEKDSSNDEYNLSGVKYGSKTKNVNLNLFPENEYGKRMLVKKKENNQDEFTLELYKTEYNKKESRWEYVILKSKTIYNINNKEKLGLDSKNRVYFSGEKLVLIKETDCKDGKTRDSNRGTVLNSKFVVGITTELMSNLKGTLEEVYQGLEIGSLGNHRYKGFLMKFESKMEDMPPQWYTQYIYGGTDLFGSFYSHKKDSKSPFISLVHAKNSKREIGQDPFTKPPALPEELLCSDEEKESGGSTSTKNTVKLKGNFSNSNISQAVVFYATQSYRISKLEKGKMSLDLPTDFGPAALCFADSSNNYLGYLTLGDGIDALPMGFLKSATKEIDLGDLSLNTDKKEVTSSSFKIKSSKKFEGVSDVASSLAVLDDFFAIKVKNADMDDNGKVDILEKKQYTVTPSYHVDGKGKPKRFGLVFDFQPKPANKKVSLTLPDGKSPKNPSHIQDPQSPPSGDYVINMGDTKLKFALSAKQNDFTTNLIFPKPALDFDDNDYLTKISWKWQTPPGVTTSVDRIIDRTHFSTQVYYELKDNCIKVLSNDIHDTTSQITIPADKKIKKSDILSVVLYYEDIYGVDYEVWIEQLANY